MSRYNEKLINNFFSIFVISILLLLFISNSWCEDKNSIKKRVEVLYSKWLNEHITVGPSSNTGDFYELKSFQEIVSIGMDVIPILLETINREDAFQVRCVAIAIQDIMKMRFDNSFSESNSDAELLYIENWLNDYESITKRNWLQIYSKWAVLSPKDKYQKLFTLDWDKEYGNDPQARLIAFEQWQQMPEGPEKERMRPYNRTVYQRLLDLGIPALPFAVEKIKMGDRDLLEAVNIWTDSSLDKYIEQRSVNLKSASRAELSTVVNQWWSENREKYTLPD